MPSSPQASIRPAQLILERGRCGQAPVMAVDRRREHAGCPRRQPCARQLVVGTDPASSLFRGGQAGLPRTSGLTRVVHQAQIICEIPGAEGLAESAGTRRRSGQMILQPVTGTRPVSTYEPTTRPYLLPKPSHLWPGQ
jgi:hypothetical protein